MADPLTSCPRPQLELIAKRHATRMQALQEQGASSEIEAARSKADTIQELLGLLQSRLARRQQWLNEAAAALASSPGMPHVEALLREARIMQIQDKVYDQLQRLATSGYNWQKKCETLLASSGVYSPGYVIELVSEGKSLSLELPSTARLEEALSQARLWQQEADALLARGREGGTWEPQKCAPRDELAALLERPEASLLLLPQSKELRDELSHERPTEFECHQHDARLKIF